MKLSELIDIARQSWWRVPTGWSRPRSSRRVSCFRFAPRRTSFSRVRKRSRSSFDRRDRQAARDARRSCTGGDLRPRLPQRRQEAVAATSGAAYSTDECSSGQTRSSSRRDRQGQGRASARWPKAARRSPRPSRSRRAPMSRNVNEATWPMQVARQGAREDGRSRRSSLLICRRVSASLADRRRRGDLDFALSISRGLGRALSASPTRSPLAISARRSMSRATTRSAI